MRDHTLLHGVQIIQIVLAKYYEEAPMNGPVNVSQICRAFYFSCEQNSKWDLLRVTNGPEWRWVLESLNMFRVYVQSIIAPSVLSALFMNPNRLTLVQRGFHIFVLSWKKSVRGSHYSINEETATAKQFLSMPSKYFLQLGNVHFDKHYEKFINVFWDYE